ncbi:MAG: hypothetical protein IJW72_03270 [Alphaproteobacteria bacterium]|nr:hypothetical protein [Alphaproteobacteria bacterium]
MNKFFDDAVTVAQTFDVSTPKNGLVLYSVSFLPTKENRDKAFAFVKDNIGVKTIEDTPCGKKLVELGFASSDLPLTQDMIAEVWAIASDRMIKSAEGNVIAFVDGADSRSVFCRVELPNILKNDKIVTINGEDKYLFAKKFMIM